MKTMIPFTAAAFALLTAGAAMAETLEVGGEVERICTLPSSWNFVSSAGAFGNQFSGTTWTIPEAAFAGPSSNAVTGSEYAIRIRGTGFCNTAHTIRLQSAHGGLASDSTETTPDGFARRRAMKYDAYWSQNGVSEPFGPKISYSPTTAGQQSPIANYVISDALAPPGSRTFDIRLGLQRGGPATPPLVAGDYSDTVTVTLTLAP